MHRNCLIALVLFVILFTVGGTAAKTESHKPEGTGVTAGSAVLWRDPVDIASRSLFYGPGGTAHEPVAPFTFQEEDRGGSTPKFDVVDADGVRWNVKLGSEARPETVASRFVWAAGYFASDEYFMPVLHVQGMKRLHRGRSHVDRDGTVHDARLKRHPQDQRRVGAWSWETNPFKGSREWYGLQVLMAVMNNWDLKDENNAIYQVGGDHPEQHYAVSDLGATFGAAWMDTLAKVKGNLKMYEDSDWIGKTEGGIISFNVPAAPPPHVFFNLPEFTMRMRLRWLGRNIPVGHAKWIGQLLGHLSPGQIRDAFRAAGYSPEEVEGYGKVVEKRIAELNAL